MARIYSDEEIERLSKNPFVSHVSRQRMTLTLDFRQYVYDIWVQDPVPMTIKKLLLKNGFEASDIGKDFCKNIGLAFKRSGRPRWSYGPAYNAETTNIPVPAGTEMAALEKSSTPAPSDRGHDGRESIRDALAGSGRLVIDGEAIRFAPDYAAKLFSTYPQVSLYEALSRDGFTPSEIGIMQVHKLEKAFALCLAAGTAPCESREEGRWLEDGEVAALRRNPFVESASPASVSLNGSFFLAASALKGLGTDLILDVFMTGHRNFTVTEKTGIRDRLDRPAGGVPGVGAFGGTAYDARILRRRMGALEGVAREGFGRISGRFQALKPYMKKQVCLWVEGLPPRPRTRADQEGGPEAGRHTEVGILQVREGSRLGDMGGPEGGT